jgi:hypothetical protein
MRTGRLIAALLLAGLALVVAGIALYGASANAATPWGHEASPPEYTNHPTRVATATRTIDLFVDPDFDSRERERIVAALRQWNYVLNGYIRFEGHLMRGDVSEAEIQRIRRDGGFVVLRVDSRHPVAHRGEGVNALAVTVSGGRGGGVVYVISDRIGGRDLTGVVMHEFGHVLGAGHDQSGLMAPVYSAAGSHCIDYDAVTMVAQVQRLPVRDLNWCEMPGRDRRYEARSVVPGALSESFRNAAPRPGAALSEIR